MKKYAFINPNGDAEYTASPATDDTYIDGEIYNGLVCREIPQTADDTEVIEGWYWVDDGYFVRPPKPTDFHAWSSVTETWLPNLDAAKAAKKAEIEAERNRRINEPLIYDGKVLDADQTARDNLKAKLEEVRERIRLNMPMAPELLVWRDNGNVTHSWPTIEAYHDWLAGYAVAMSDRGTRCYACAWYHKDALGQLNTVEAVTGYIIINGWPA